ncbi:DUF4023 family protein [Paenibacillus xylaniclasticus]|nr:MULTISPECIES: DUF4023 family protein [Paenibacillus]GFN31509.1 hypothetical protein PCURB6_17690 [Paenibacillus curdlanolyticus]
MTNTNTGDTGQFVNEVKAQQHRQEKNKQRFGKGTPSQSLPTKQHANNP